MNNSNNDLLEALGLGSIKKEPTIIDLTSPVKIEFKSPKRELVSPIITTNHFQWNYDENNNHTETKSIRRSLNRKRDSIFGAGLQFTNKLPVIDSKIKSSSSKTSSLEELIVKECKSRSILKNVTNSNSTKLSSINSINSSALSSFKEFNNVSTSLSQSCSLSSNNIIDLSSSSLSYSLSSNSATNNNNIDKSLSLFSSSESSASISNDNTISSSSSSLFMSSSSSISTNIKDDLNINNSNLMSTSISISSLPVYTVSSCKNYLINTHSMVTLNHNVTSSNNDTQHLSNILTSNTSLISSPSQHHNQIQTQSNGIPTSSFYSPLLINTQHQTLSIASLPSSTPSLSPCYYPPSPPPPSEISNSSSESQTSHYLLREKSIWRPFESNINNSNLDRNNSTNSSCTLNSNINLKSKKKKLKRNTNPLLVSFPPLVTRSKFTRFPAQMATAKRFIDSNSRQFPVSMVQAHKDDLHGRSYLIKWLGWPNTDNSWVKERDCKCDIKIDQFKRRYNIAMGFKYFKDV